MRILFLVGEIPLTPDGLGGGSALFYSQLGLLAGTGHEIVLGLLSDSRSRADFESYTTRKAKHWERVQAWTSSIARLDLQSPNRGRRSVGSVLMDAWKLPATYIDASVHEVNIKALRHFVDGIEPDLIWAAEAPAALLCQAAGLEKSLVYLHLDWRFRIKRLRTGASSRRLKARYRFWQMRRAELKLVRAARACCCASATEALEAKLAGSPFVGYCPTAYEPVAASPTAAAGPPRMVHLGGMNTTATRQGLERFFEVVWPRLKKQMAIVPELLIIGDTTAASPELKASMEQPGVRRLGFVEDLGEHLRSGDIHIIPWEYATGTRTRTAIALNYGQVVVTPRTAAEPSPELRDGENCVLVPALEDMASAIAKLYDDKSLRDSIGTAARASFMRYFTSQAQQEPFRKFVDACLSGHRDSEVWSCTIPKREWPEIKVTL